MAGYESQEDGESRRLTEMAKTFVVFMRELVKTTMDAGITKAGAESARQPVGSPEMPGGASAEASITVLSPDPGPVSVPGSAVAPAVAAAPSPAPVPIPATTQTPMSSTVALAPPVPTPGSVTPVSVPEFTPTAQVTDVKQAPFAISMVDVRPVEPPTTVQADMQITAPAMPSPVPVQPPETRPAPQPPRPAQIEVATMIDVVPPQMDQVRTPQAAAQAPIQAMAWNVSRESAVATPVRPVSVPEIPRMPSPPMVSVPPPAPKDRSAVSLPTSPRSYADVLKTPRMSSQSPDMSEPPPLQVPKVAMEVMGAASPDDPAGLSDAMFRDTDDTRQMDPTVQMLVSDQVTRDKMERLWRRTQSGIMQRQIRDLDDDYRRLESIDGAYQAGRETIWDVNIGY